MTQINLNMELKNELDDQRTISETETRQSFRHASTGNFISSQLVQILKRPISRRRVRQIRKNDPKLQYENMKQGSNLTLNHKRIRETRALNIVKFDSVRLS